MAEFDAAIALLGLVDPKDEKSSDSEDTGDTMKLEKTKSSPTTRRSTRVLEKRKRESSIDISNTKKLDQKDDRSDVKAGIPISTTDVERDISGMAAEAPVKYEEKALDYNADGHIDKIASVVESSHDQQDNREADHQEANRVVSEAPLQKSKDTSQQSPSQETRRLSTSHSSPHDQLYQQQYPLGSMPYPDHYRSASSASLSHSIEVVTTLPPISHLSQTLTQRPERPQSQGNQPTSSLPTVDSSSQNSANVYAPPLYDSYANQKISYAPGKPPPAQNGNYFPYRHQIPDQYGIAPNLMQSPSQGGVYGPYAPIDPVLSSSVAAAATAPGTQQIPQIPMTASATATVPGVWDINSRNAYNKGRFYNPIQPKDTSGPEPSASTENAPAVVVDDKRFECMECNRKFRRREHLKRHISTLHQRDKPFSCEFCNRRFSRGDNLLQHSRMRHR
ncbi:hypothetical protein V1511DRAFT_334395 [Dipodascopsis uninucleata]